MATPVILGEQLNPPRYGDNWSEQASRIFFSAYREYKERVQFANDMGLCSVRSLVSSQLIPVDVQRCSARNYFQRKVLHGEELLDALKQHAGFFTLQVARYCERRQHETFARWRKCCKGAVIM